MAICGAVGFLNLNIETTSIYIIFVELVPKFNSPALSSVTEPPLLFAFVTINQEGVFILFIVSYASLSKIQQEFICKPHAVLGQGVLINSNHSIKSK